MANRCLKKDDQVMKEYFRWVFLQRDYVSSQQNVQRGDFAPPQMLFCHICERLSNFRYFRTIAAAVAGGKHGKRHRLTLMARQQAREAPPPLRKNGGNRRAYCRCGSLRCCHLLSKSAKYSVKGSNELRVMRNG
jgi:hypothetical protein